DRRPGGGSIFDELAVSSPSPVDAVLQLAGEANRTRFSGRLTSSCSSAAHTKLLVRSAIPRRDVVVHRLVAAAAAAAVLLVPAAASARSAGAAAARAAATVKVPNLHCRRLDKAEDSLHRL